MQTDPDQCESRCERIVFEIKNRRSQLPRGGRLKIRVEVTKQIIKVTSPDQPPPKKEMLDHAELWKGQGRPVIILY